MFTSPKSIAQMVGVATAAACLLTGCLPGVVTTTDGKAAPAESVYGDSVDRSNGKSGAADSAPTIAATVPAEDSSHRSGGLLPGTPAAPDTGSVIGSYGDTLTVDGVRVSLSNLRLDPCSPDDYRAAYPGETYLLVDATLTNDSFPGEPEYYGSFMSAWGLTYQLPGDDSTYRGDYPFLPCHTFEDNDSVIDGDYLSIGDTVNVTLIFAVPTDAVELAVTWNGSTNLPANTATFTLSV